MSLYILGDVHGQWNFLNHFLWYTLDLNESSAYTVVQLGDFGYFPKLGMDPASCVNVPKNCQLFFIAGNHDDHSILKKLPTNEPTKIGERLYYVPFGYTLEVENKRILCLGGGHSPDKGLRHEGYDWFPNEDIQDEEYLSLTYDKKPSLVVSHSTPDFLTPKLIKTGQEVIRDKTSFYLGKIFKNLYEAGKAPKNWYAGHFHMRKDFEYRGTEFHIINEIQTVFHNEFFEKIA